jgi:HEAT repeats
MSRWKFPERRGKSFKITRPLLKNYEVGPLCLIVGTSRSNSEVWSAFLAGASPAARLCVEKLSAEKKPADETPPFLDYALEVFEAGDPARPGPLASALVQSELVIGAISDPAQLSLDQAIRLARAAGRFDHAIDYKILSSTTSSAHNWPDDVPRHELMRMLKVIEAISDCQRLVLPLMKLAKTPQRHLRSKAVKLMARASRNAGWADSILNDPDPRVRSNLIEGVTEQFGEKARPILRKAARDPHHRVSITALLALTRIGDQESREILEKMAIESDDPHRRAAEWALRTLAQSVTPSSEAPRPTA